MSKRVCVKRPSWNSNPSEMSLDVNRGTFTELASLSRVLERGSETKLDGGTSLASCKEIKDVHALSKGAGTP
jgi:hypothetical protein